VPRFAIAPLNLTTEGSTKFKLKGWKCYLKKLQCTVNNGNAQKDGKPELGIYSELSLCETLRKPSLTQKPPIEDMLTSDFFDLLNFSWRHHWNRRERGSTLLYLNTLELPTQTRKKYHLSSIYPLDCTVRQPCFSHHVFFQQAFPHKNARSALCIFI